MLKKIEFLEPEMESLLQRIVPGYEVQVKGATQDQIEYIEQIAGCPLPGFYLWFLKRMGADMGPFAYPPIDFTATAVINSYEQGLINREPSLLLIGYDSRDIPNHHFYDLECPQRNDMLVVSGVETNNLFNSFETFREMFAYDKLSKYKQWKFPQQCEGVLRDTQGDVLAKIHSVMPSYGFTSPIQTGDFCVLYERDDSVFTVTTFVKSSPKLEFIYFGLGGSDKNTVLDLLSRIAFDADLTLKIDSWDPPSK